MYLNYIRELVDGIPEKNKILKEFYQQEVEYLQSL